uniref:Uncharacterized protein n=1 Tax=Acrobeloides nanus TaxID=290746 RepID=A0A914D6V1_9BILA
MQKWAIKQSKKRGRKPKKEQKEKNPVYVELGKRAAEVRYGKKYGANLDQFERNKEGKIKQLVEDGEKNNQGFWVFPGQEHEIEERYGVKLIPWSKRGGGKKRSQSKNVSTTPTKKAKLDNQTPKKVMTKSKVHTKPKTAPVYKTKKTRKSPVKTATTRKAPAKTSTIQKAPVKTATTRKTPTRRGAKSMTSSEPVTLTEPAKSTMNKKVVRSAKAKAIEFLKDKK